MSPEVALVVREVVTTKPATPSNNATFAVIKPYRTKRRFARLVPAKRLERCLDNRPFLVVVPRNTISWEVVLLIQISWSTDRYPRWFLIVVSRKFDLFLAFFVRKSAGFRIGRLLVTDVHDLNAMVISISKPPCYATRY